MPERELGRLLASGRDSDIFEYGPRSVLRRSPRGRSMATEARTMEHARAHGYPVPAVEEIGADGTDLVIERVDGPSMVEALARRPWTVRHQGTVLAKANDPNMSSEEQQAMRRLVNSAGRGA